MVMKRQFGEEGSENSPIHNHSQNPPSKFRKVVNSVLKEVSQQDIATKICVILEPIIRKVVKEELEPLVFYLQSSPRRSLVLQSESSASRVLQLHFAKKLPSTLFTNSGILDENHDALQIMLVDGKSKNVIQHSTFSSLKVEIFVLNADFAADGKEDWSESEFSGSIVSEREGKRPLLIGDRSLSLVNGVGFVGNVSFTDNSSWVRSRKFRLGVRAVSSAAGDTAIREAVSEPFVVLDHRGESYQKHATPFLDDPVWRLKKISKMGASHKKLESLGIKTVKDFLVQLHINPSSLLHVLGKGVPKRAWETIVNHANECHLDNTQYRYYNAEERVELIFNCVYKVIEAKFEGQTYQPLHSLDFHQKALVDKLNQIALNQNELTQIQNLSATPLLPSSTIQQSNTFFGANMELPEVNQDEPGQQLDFKFSDSASQPNTIEDGYLPDEDSTAQSNQQGFSPAAFLWNDSAPESSLPDYSWYPNNLTPTYVPNAQFGEISHHQTSPFYSFATTWGQDIDNDLLATLAPASHVGVLSTPHDFGVNILGTEKPKAGWCKIRAAVMWKIVRRYAAARKKAKFPAQCC